MKAENVVDINQETSLPLGQKLLSLGYRVITMREIRDILRCNYLTEERTRRIVARLEEQYPLVVITDDAVLAYKSKWHKFMGNWGAYEWIRKCDVKSHRLDDYIGKRMPDRVIKKINELSEYDLDMHVMEPTLLSPDPVVVAKLGDNWLYIDHWGDDSDIILNEE